MEDGDDATVGPLRPGEAAAAPAVLAASHADYPAFCHVVGAAQAAGGPGVAAYRAGCATVVCRLRSDRCVRPTSACFAGRAADQETPPARARMLNAATDGAGDGSWRDGREETLGLEDRKTDVLGRARQTLVE